MSQSHDIKIAILGGTGLEIPSMLEDINTLEVDTPFGKPSSFIYSGKLSGVEVVFISRHGIKHEFNPTNVNYKANIWALKHLGVTNIITSNACGSLKENYAPGDFALVDQFIDFTRFRTSTFYDGKSDEFKGVCHIPMAKPFCELTRQIIYDCAVKLGYKTHQKASIVVIEGPRFSSKSESLMFRGFGGDLIGMTTCPEVCLANELGIGYATIALVTDYDCWSDHHDSVTQEDVGNTFKQSVTKIKNLLKETITELYKHKKELLESKAKMEKNASSSVILH